MRPDFSPLRRSTGGFSLVELLVVVSIIALLVGLVTVGVGKGLEAGDKTKAKAEVTAIVSAVKAYYQEYGVYPLKPSQRGPAADEYFSWVGPVSAGGAPSQDCKNLMRVLCGENLALENTPMNPKQIRFLEGPQSDGTFLDPWGMAYSVKMDTNESGGLEYYDPGYAENVRVKVIAVSYGKDKTQSDPNLKYTKTFDDIFSWDNATRK